MYINIYVYIYYYMVHQGRRSLRVVRFAHVHMLPGGQHTPSIWIDMPQATAVREAEMAGRQTAQEVQGPSIDVSCATCHRAHALPWCEGHP